ncbi:MAG TPA: hypothetical protein VK504_10850, partial [Vicinamibacterales bacterium]|nr:hypothetical protein [Vicinamibacterales bacterium]
MATRSLPAPNTDGETDSGITWPPVEKLELVWFEKSPPPEEVVENFRIVPLNEIGARAGLPVEPPAPVEPAEAPETTSLESWTPATAVALAAPPVTVVERLPAIDQFRFPPAGPVVIRESSAQWFFTGTLAVCAVGLLVLIVAFWWRGSAATVQTTQAPSAVVADSHASPSPQPPDIRRPVARPAKPPTAPARTPKVHNQKAQAAVRAKSAVVGRQPAKVPVQAKVPIQRNASANRPAAPTRPAQTVKPKPSVGTVPPAPEAALTAVTPQPLPPQPTVGAPVQIEERPARPAPRAVTSAPAAAPAAPAVVPPSDEQRIRAVLRSYQTGFEQFDPGAVQAVWPSVDAKALGRAF